MINFSNPSLGAHGRSVCPLSTYYPRSTNNMEADTGADMEDTVILSRFSSEVVVCEDKVGGKGERGLKRLSIGGSLKKYTAAISHSL